MDDDEFQCTNCGDVLKGGMIDFYRRVLENGGDIAGGGIRCGNCGSVFTPQQVANVQKSSVFTSSSCTTKNESDPVPVIAGLFFVVFLIAVWVWPFGHCEIFTKIFVTLFLSCTF